MNGSWRWMRLTAALLGVGSLAACGWLGGGKSPSPSGLQFPLGRAPVADTWATTGLLPGSQDAAAESVPINPFDPIALNNQAVVEASRGRYQQALSLLQRAVKLAPARPDIAANLSSMQRWLAQAEGQAALGLQPQALQLPYQETGLQPVPPLWRQPVSPAAPAATGAVAPASPSAPGTTAAPMRPAVSAAQPVQPQAASRTVRPAKRLTYRASSSRAWRRYQADRSTRPYVPAPVNGPQANPAR